MSEKQQIIKNIQKIKKQLSKLGPFIPGSISKQFSVCGKPNCKCKDENDPKKHGPYYKLSYTFQGKSHTEFVQENNLEETEKQINNFKKFKQLNIELTENYLNLFKIQKKEGLL